MSSRDSTPDDDNMRAMREAMAQSSPPKRTHSTMTGNKDPDNEHTASSTTSGVCTIGTNQNIVSAARQYAERKRLRSDQVTALEVFLNVSRTPLPLRGQDAHRPLGPRNQVEKIVTSKPTFEVSEDCKTNIRKYAPAVLLSSKINVYKGEGITHILTDIIKRHRFDLPPGVEHVPADWAKVLAIVQDALMQTRSKVKKEIGWSLKVNKSDDLCAPLAQHKNIYQLAQAIVKGTQCSVNVVLCACIAVMRAVYLEHPGSKFWDQMDKRLARIRKMGGNDAKKITKYWCSEYYPWTSLEVDQAKHGVQDSYELDETVVDEFQQKIDDLIDIHAVDAATSSTQGDAAAVA
ncbi:hypothetical protein DFH08DRAFT_798697 [Mycena albidolilacea]|uniref:Uncharacterized protein n=1 Tax=Mycena albidolilacea TaxID=1033008 RepID=A0AAD7AP64_9AGAR|nr:hypothetical protein DFH08DRAFT_798697 [Mycena albidolilacea]